MLIGLLVFACVSASYLQKPALCVPLGGVDISFSHEHHLNKVCHLFQHRPLHCLCHYQYSAIWGKQEADQQWHLLH